MRASGRALARRGRGAVEVRRPPKNLLKKEQNKEGGGGGGKGWKWGRTVSKDDPAVGERVEVRGRDLARPVERNVVETEVCATGKE